MKVWILNGSPHSNGNTATALQEMIKVFEEEGIEVDLQQVGHLDIRGCIGCRKCAELNRCVFDDVVNQSAKRLEEADGIVIASPVYFASANATLIAFLTRLFYSSRKINRAMKVGASVAVARRGGITSTFDELNKFLTNQGMAVATSQYWNGVHGQLGTEAEQDAEGLQTMRYLAHNMAFLMKCIADGKEKYGIPQKEPRINTNFVR